MRKFPVIAIPLVVVSLCLLTICAGFANESRSNWATEAYKKNQNSVIFIQGDKVEERRGGAADPERTFNGMGSGIVIDERGYIITNYHVVKDIRKIQVKTYDQNDYIAELVAKDIDTDLALIKINPRSPLRPIIFGRSNDLMVGEACMAIGNPYGYVFSLTNGLISAINREVGVNDSPLVYRAAIQTNTAINPGNSGGPLINVDGEMIGINVAIRQGSNAIAFASPVDQVVEVAAKLMKEIVDQRIVHGLTISQNEPRDYNTFKRFYIRVESVESNSPAALAGIQEGDILYGIGKYTVKNKLDFYRALLDLKANDEIAFTFFRKNGSELQDVAVAVRAPRSGALAQRNISPQPAPVIQRTASQVQSPSERNAELDKLIWENLGIQYTAIPAREYERTFQTFLDEFSGGVVVKAVRSGSPAEQVGLIEQDVIVGVEQWEITSANDMRWMAQNLLAKKERLLAKVIRDGTLYNADVPLK